MLVLSRKKHESIKVGDVEFTIVEIRGNTVKVGIEAPDDVLITRTNNKENKK